MTLKTANPLPGRRGPDPLTKIVIICIVAGGLLWLFAQLAHAGPLATVPAGGIDWNFWLALAGAVLGGLSVVLHVVAPRTKNTWDDKLRDDVDEVLTWYRDQRPSPVKLASGPGSGTATMLVVLLIGAGLALSPTGCATGKAAIAEGAVAFLECEDGHLDAVQLADFKAAASAELRHLLEGKAAPDPAALKADLAPYRSDLARCGWAAAIAGLGALITPPTPGIAVSALVAAGPDPAVVRDRFAAAARSLGWAPMHVAGG